MHGHARRSRPSMTGRAVPCPERPGHDLQTGRNQSLAPGAEPALPPSVIRAKQPATQHVIGGADGPTPTSSNPAVANRRADSSISELTTAVAPWWSGTAQGHSASSLGLVPVLNTRPPSSPAAEAEALNYAGRPRRILTRFSVRLRPAAPDARSCRPAPPATRPTVPNGRRNRTAVARHDMATAVCRRTSAGTTNVPVTVWNSWATGAALPRSGAPATGIPGHRAQCGTMTRFYRGRQFSRKIQMGTGGWEQTFPVR